MLRLAALGESQPNEDAVGDRQRGDRISPVGSHPFDDFSPTEPVVRGLAASNATRPTAAAAERREPAAFPESVQSCPSLGSAFPDGTPHALSTPVTDQHREYPHRGAGRADHDCSCLDPGTGSGLCRDPTSRARPRPAADGPGRRSSRPTGSSPTRRTCSTPFRRGLPVPSPPSVCRGKIGLSSPPSGQKALWRRDPHTRGRPGAAPCPGVR